MAVRGHERAEAVRRQLVNKLQASEGVTVGVDGWTNVNGHKVVNLCPVAGGVAYYWDSVVLRQCSAATDQLGPVAAALDALIKKSVRITAIVTDNEQVNTALFNRLRPTFPFLLHIPCAAHTIQLCVKKAMRLQGVFEVVDALIALLMTYKASKKLRVGLTQQQAILRKGQPVLYLVKANDTRWNSLLLAAQRVLKLLNCIIPFTEQIRGQIAKVKSKVKRERWGRYTFCQSTFWQPLQALVDFLIPFKTATDVVQSDASNPADIHQQFSALVVHVDGLSPSHFLAPLRSNLLNVIKEEWDTHVNVNTIITSAHLSLDSSYNGFTDEQKAEASSWFITWGVEYLSYYHLANTDDRAAIEVTLLQQYGQFRRKTNAFAQMESDHQKLSTAHNEEQLKKPVKARRRYNPRDTWSLITADELATLALALLSVTASEAAVERSFSRQGLVHSKLRNRLADDSVHMQMFFSFNTRALEQPDRHNGASVQEMEDDNTRGTTLLSSAADYYADDEIIARESESDKEEDKDEVEEDAAEGQLDVQSEAEEQEEEEEEGNGKEEKEEEEETKEEAKEEKSESEKLNEFVDKYAADNRIVRGHRWTSWQRQVLQGALLQHKIKTQEGDVVNLIRKHVGEQGKPQ
jgi:hypothetical protein